MSHFFESIVSIPPPFNMVVLIVLIISSAGIVTSIAKQIRKYACHRQELDFKRELLDRGLSSQEIREIIKAHTPRNEGS